MLPMNDVFYARTEAVWILNHNRDDGTDEEDNESGSSRNSPESRGYSPPSSSHQYPHPPEEPQNERYSPPTSNHYHDYYSDGHYFAWPGYNSTAERPSSSHQYPYPPEEPQNERYSPPTSNHYHDYYSDGHYFAWPGYNSTAQRETEVVLKVPICCGSCEDSVRAALHDLKGVKSVKCDIYNERVTVVVTTGAPADVLAKCKKVFKKSRWWENDD